MRVPPQSRYHKSLTAAKDGVLSAIDNRRLARLAKLAGAPQDKAAGVELHARLGDRLERNMPLCTVHAEALGELAYALSYADANPSIFELGES
jgi:thymidine phosphorylase